MSDQSLLDAQIAAVRAFTTGAEQAAQILDCSLADAAEFLVKLGPFVALMNDTDFRAKLDRYCQAIAEQTIPKLMLVPKPSDRSVH